MSGKIEAKSDSEEESELSQLEQETNQKEVREELLVGIADSRQ